ncbi:hypothetical protein VTH06DRAFT_8520 [Thermothelomyces fergusii]
MAIQRQGFGLAAWLLLRLASSSPVHFYFFVVVFWGKGDGQHTTWQKNPRANQPDSGFLIPGNIDTIGRSVRAVKWVGNLALFGLAAQDNALGSGHPGSWLEEGAGSKGWSWFSFGHLQAEA